MAEFDVFDDDGSVDREKLGRTQTAAQELLDRSDEVPRRWLIAVAYAHHPRLELPYLARCNSLRIGHGGPPSRFHIPPSDPANIFHADK